VAETRMRLIPVESKGSSTARGVSCAICGRIPTSDGCSRHKTSWKNPAGCRPVGSDDGPRGRLLETETCIGMDGRGSVESTTGFPLGPETGGSRSEAPAGFRLLCRQRYDHLR